MPITKSTKKRLRQNPVRREVNAKRISEMKKLMKEALSLLSQQNKAEVEKMLPNIYKAIDKAAKRGVIKKNTAARKKSRIAKKLNAIK
jgi:small subunit ribosomal protein S20